MAALITLYVLPFAVKMEKMDAFFIYFENNGQIHGPEAVEFRSVQLERYEWTFRLSTGHCSKLEKLCLKLKQIQLTKS